MSRPSDSAQPSSGGSAGSDPVVSCHECYPEFYGNDAIAVLAPNPRWTISGQLKDDPKKKKAPADMRELIDNGRLRGAFANDETCLVTLEELTRAFPTATNAAFYLRAQADGLMMIDIESECPVPVAQTLLELPGIVYSELSMSGRGYHLLAPLPANFLSHPVAAGKRVLREEHGWYEILLEHWATFTRMPIPADRYRTAGTASATSTADPADCHPHPHLRSVEALFESLAQHARESAAGSQVEVAMPRDEAPPEIAFRDELVQIATRAPLPKTLADFHGDNSKWEFSVLSTLLRRIERRMQYRMQRTRQSGGTPLVYTDSDKAWVLYLAAREVIPYRPKHSETRNGRPLLLDRAAWRIAQDR